MKNILLPTDFSDNARNAIRYAINLFKDEKCVFHLLNTYTPVIVHSRFMAANLKGGMAEDTVHLSSEEGLEHTVEEILKTHNYPNHSFETVSSFSILVDEVRDMVKTRNIDLVVTGTKGASGLDEVFMGTNTMRIINAVKTCPVLAIPQHYSYEQPKEIAFVTDYKRSFDASTVLPLISLASMANASIRIMHINEERALDKVQESNMYTLMEYVSPLNHTLHWMPNFTGKSTTIKLFLDELGIDMLTMINYRHSFLEKLLREPVIKKISFNLEVPFLVIPDPDY